MYNKIVLDHFQNPRNLLAMKNPSATGMGASQVCGDIMTLYLQIDKNKITDASYTTMGCGAAIAAGSVLTEMLRGKSLEEAKAINHDALLNALGDLPKIKLHCPDLALEALQMAFKDFSKKNDIKKPSPTSR